MEMAEIIYVRDANGNLVQTTIKDLREYELKKLEEENKKLKELKCIPTNLKTVIRIDEENEKLKAEIKKLKEIIKDHQLYEEKLEHRIIEFEELLHGE